MENGGTSIRSETMAGAKEPEDFEGPDDLDDEYAEEELTPKEKKRREERGKATIKINKDGTVDVF
jgi:hypothetical protein